MDLAKHFARTRGVDALTVPEVAARIGLSDQQRRWINSVQRQSRHALRQRVREKFTGLKGRAGLAEMLVRAREEANAQIMQVLTEEQRRRFALLVRRKAI